MMAVSPLAVVGTETAVPCEITFAAEGPATLATEVATATVFVGYTCTSFTLVFLDSLRTQSAGATVVYLVWAQTSCRECQVYSSLM